MSEEFIADPRNRLVAITRTDAKGYTYNLALDLHKANGCLLGAHWYINDSDTKWLDPTEFGPEGTKPLYLNDRILMFEPQILRAILNKSHEIEARIISGDTDIPKTEAATIFSCIYHLLNRENLQCKNARETFEKVFAALELGPILPASVLVKKAGGGLSDMQLKAQKDTSAGAAP